MFINQIVHLSLFCSRFLVYLFLDANMPTVENTYPEPMNILRQLFEIILNKRAPEDVDYNVNAAITACASHVFILFTFYSLFNEFSQPLLYAIILTSSTLLAFVVLLKLHGKETKIAIEL